MIVAGLGYRKSITTAQVQLALARTLNEYRIDSAQLAQIAIPAMKELDAGILAAATARGIPVVRIEQRDMEDASPRALTRSLHSLAAHNVPSVAETVALAAGGRGARLLGVRIAVGPVTCALAEADLP